MALFTDRGLIRCDFLIAADGAGSRVRRLTGCFNGFEAGFAVEGIADRAASTTPPMGFDFDPVNGGYGWVFPKGETINVGLYRQRGDIAPRRGELIAYAGLRLGRTPVRRIVGQALGMGGWRYRPGYGRILLTGDAAGLVDPLLGEGLYHAVISGQHAAAAVADAAASGRDACRGYAEAIRPIQHELHFSDWLGEAFYLYPRAGYLLLISPAFRVALMGGFAQGLTLPASLLNGYRFWLGRGRMTRTGA